MSSSVSNQIRLPSTISERRRKRMRTKSRVQPWRDEWEMEEVGRSVMMAVSLLNQDGALSPDNIDPQSQARLVHGLSMVSVWKARSEQGRLPHSIETSFSFAQILWRDAQSSPLRSDSLLPSSIELRLAYASALVRGVNGLADVMQQQRAVAASVASLCEQIGLPGWLVDLRHDAAHNDLPSLPTLRLAAKTFLGYLDDRYWTPLANTRREQSDRAVQILLNYKATVKGILVSTAESSEVVLAPSGDPQTLAPPVDTKQGLSEASGSSSSANEEETNSDFGLWDKSTVGTSVNRFAALFEAPKPSVPKKSPPRKRNKQEKAKAIAPPAATPIRFAKAFVRDTPISVGYHVALSFLVWGGVGDLPEGRGVLIPGSPLSFPESTEGIEKIQSRYKPLLRTIYFAWPGFATALLTHLVEFAFSISPSEEPDSFDASSRRKAFFILSWIQFLLSREFHSSSDQRLLRSDAVAPTEKPILDGAGENSSSRLVLGPSLELRAVGFPLKALFDRCSRPGWLPRDIAALFEATGFLAEAAHENAANAPDPSVRKANDSKLSLDEMEDYLMTGGDKVAERVPGCSDAGNGFPDVDDEGRKETRVGGWTLCDSWDACAIGSLPGHPV